MKASELHQQVETAVNAADVEALVTLYEPGAVLLAEGGATAMGTDAIRGVWAALVNLGGRMTVTTRSAVEVGDLALLSNLWTFELGGNVVASAITAEVARLQADGTWRYVIDNPYAATG